MEPPPKKQKTEHILDKIKTAIEGFEHEFDQYRNTRVGNSNPQQMLSYCSHAMVYIKGLIEGAEAELEEDEEESDVPPSLMEQLNGLIGTQVDYKSEQSPKNYSYDSIANGC